MSSSPTSASPLGLDRARPTGPACWSCSPRGLRLPDPRDLRGIRHPAGMLLAVGIAAVLAGSRSYAAIGEWVIDQPPGALEDLGVSDESRPEKSCLRRLFARVDADALDRVLGAWMFTRTAVRDGRRVIAIDGKTVRGARTANAVAPHLVAALDHTTGSPEHRPGAARGRREEQRDPRCTRPARHLRPDRRRHHRRCHAHPDRYRSGHHFRRRGVRVHHQGQPAAAAHRVQEASLEGRPRPPGHQHRSPVNMAAPSPGPSRSSTLRPGSRSPAPPNWPRSAAP